MKKLLLTMFASILILNLNAQDLKEARFYYPEFDADAVEGLFGQIVGVSSNGEYAVGYDHMLGSGAFVWTRSTGEFEIVELGALLMDASNDGILVGNYWVEIPGGSGALATRPGYYKAGEWYPLPIHRLEAELDSDSEENTTSELNGTATAISGDAKFIAGYITDANIYKLYPVLWQWNDENAEYIIANEFENIQENIDLLDCPIGWYVKDMSDDGTILTGYSEWGSGARSAAVLINGEEKRLTGLYDPVVEAEKNPDVEYGMFDSWAKVSANGKYFTGIYSEDTSSGGLTSFTWNQSQDSVTFLEEQGILVCADNNGIYYGTSHFSGIPIKYENGEIINLEDEYAWEDGADVLFSTIQATSDDGSVLGGLCVGTFGASSINIPGVLVLGAPASVDAVKGEANDVFMYAGYAFIEGAYNNAVVYNVQGMVVAEATEGNIDLNNQPAGVYVVNVDGKSFKVVK